jgi:DNA-binding response OmpR family regulator
MLTTNARVLIADGEPELRRRLYSRLLELDMYSDCVANGKVAMEFLQDREYGIVILDLAIAKVDAADIIEAIARIPQEKRPMILATTSSDSRPTLDSELVQIVLRKPFSVEDVAAIVRSCMTIAADEAAPDDGVGEGTSTRRRAASSG